MNSKHTEDSALRVLTPFHLHPPLLTAASDLHLRRPNVGAGYVDGYGMGQTRENHWNSDAVSLTKDKRERVENRPKPDMTKPVAIAR